MEPAPGQAGGVAVAWTYHVAHVHPPLDAILWRLFARFAASWSSVPGYISATHTDPIPDLEAAVAAAFGGPDVVRELHFPLYIRAAQL